MARNHSNPGLADIGLPETFGDTAEFWDDDVQYSIRRDAEDTWLYQDKFDLIHARLMSGSFQDWPKFFRQAYE